VWTTELSVLPDVGSAAESMSVYGCALRRGYLVAGDPSIGTELGLSDPVVAGSLADLVALHLLRQEQTGDGCRLVPVSPKVAAASLISPIDEEIHRREAEVGRIQARLDAFRPQYEQRRGAESGGQVDSVPDAIELAGHLHLAAERCRRELLAFRPDGWFGLERATALAAGGIRVRLLLQHARRSDLRTRAQLRELAGRRGEIRTTGPSPQQLIVFDDEVAFLMHDEGAPDRVGVVVQHPDAVRLLRGLAESTWDAAMPYSPIGIGYEDAVDDLQQTIVELLAQGLTDEVIARRLGISVRTCRRHIAKVLTNLDAVSRFEAGVRAAAAGLVDPRRLRRTGLAASQAVS
jgi:DNA-binding CsgD family transcriptional regulator